MKRCPKTGQFLSKTTSKTQNGGCNQSGGALGVFATLLALNPNIFDAIYQLLETVGLGEHTDKIGELASNMLNSGQFQYSRGRMIPTAVGRITIRQFAEHMLGTKAERAIVEFVSTRLAALFNFVLSDETGKVVYPARLRGDGKKDPNTGRFLPKKNSMAGQGKQGKRKKITPTAPVSTRPKRDGARNTYHCTNRGEGTCMRICPQFWLNKEDKKLYCSWCLPSEQGAKSISVNDWEKVLGKKKKE